MSTPIETESAISAEAFLALAVRARLLTGERANTLRFLHDDASELSGQLVREGELTTFQVKKLQSGLWQGLVIGHFRILKPIGRGGMGVVYLAEDTKNHLKVALKILPPRKALAEPRTKARFLREVKIGRELPKAANIARVYETGIVDGIAFIAMEFVPGRTVKAVVAEAGPLTVEAAARIFAGVALGLAATHEASFIHRDVKPSNVMITPEGAAKLVDFGFALHTGEDLTIDPRIIGGAGYALGTFDFIPPEQAANAAAVTPAADQYSLGCSLYYSLTAQPPFPGGDAKEKIKKHRTVDPVPLSQLRPDLPVQFTAIVERLMAKKPGDRFATCREVATALQPWARNATPPPNAFAEDLFDDGSDDLEALRPAYAVRPHRGNRVFFAFALAVAVMVAGLGAIAVFLISRR